MTSYITITDAETDPSAPLTAELAKKWRDNPIAIAEGSTSAPRLQKGALGGLFLGDFTSTTTTWGGLTGLDAFEELRLDITALSINSTADTGLQIRFTADNGTTWGTAQTLLSHSPGAQDRFYHTSTVFVNLRTGARSAQGIFVGATEVVVRDLRTALTVPTLCNGFQIRGLISQTTAVQAAVFGGRP